MRFAILCMAAFLFWIASVWYIQKENKKNTKKIIFVLYGLMFIVNVAILMSLYFYHSDNAFITDLRLLFLCSVLWPIAVRDYKEQIIPNRLVMAGCVFWICTVMLQLLIDSQKVFVQFKSSLIAAVGIFVVCLICILIARNSIGMGDVKLFIMMGLLQGVNGLFSSVFYSLIISFFVACWLLITKRKNRKDGMSFGPSVLIGTTISIMFGGI